MTHYDTMLKKAKKDPFTSPFFKNRIHFSTQYCTCNWNLERLLANVWVSMLRITNPYINQRRIANPPQRAGTSAASGGCSRSGGSVLHHIILSGFSNPHNIKETSRRDRCSV